MGKPTDPTLTFKGITFNPQSVRREDDVNLICYYAKEAFEVDGILYKHGGANYFTTQCMVSIRFDQTADLEDDRSDCGWDSQYKWENFIGPMPRYY